MFKLWEYNVDWFGVVDRRAQVHRSRDHSVTLPAQSMENRRWVQHQGPRQAGVDKRREDKTRASARGRVGGRGSVAGCHRWRCRCRTCCCFFRRCSCSPTCLRPSPSTSPLKDVTGLSPVKANGLGDVAQGMWLLNSRMIAVDFVQRQNIHHVFLFIHIFVAAYQVTDRCTKCRNKVDFGDEYICCADCSEPSLMDKNSKLGYCKTGTELSVQLKPQENFKWVAGPWMKCSSPCDGGIRYRDVGCFGSIEDTSIRHYAVADSRCSGEEMELGLQATYSTRGDMEFLP
ncbi:hypothetical protein Taro_021440 [Colocasia esculenta]|uniref:Uncharacterized protein n=1 Tax=Colocasia esculenta TaxID=4460 RepID=A0A843VBH3_COLES|nr:hypothetical protein [Colocasia esculenta]